MRHNAKQQLQQRAQFPQRVFTGTYQGTECIVKWRFPKTYRHPDLDKALTSGRCKAEARSLQRCAEAGLRVPALYLSDPAQGLIVMEKVKGTTIAACMRAVAAGKGYMDTAFTVGDSGAIHVDAFAAASSGSQASPSPTPGPQPGQHTLRQLAHSIGSAIAQLHNVFMTHGDLTTSNMLALASPAEGMCLIDFGLTSKGSNQNLEDIGVDLYVLERAIASSHPQQLDVWEVVLHSYLASVDNSDSIRDRFEAVRARGRKRMAFG